MDSTSLKTEPLDVDAGDVNENTSSSSGIEESKGQFSVELLERVDLRRPKMKED